MFASIANGTASRARTAWRCNHRPTVPSANRLTCGVTSPPTPLHAIDVARNSVAMAGPSRSSSRMLGAVGASTSLVLDLMAGSMLAKSGHACPVRGTGDTEPDFSADPDRGHRAESAGKRRSGQRPVHDGPSSRCTRCPLRKSARGRSPDGQFRDDVFVDDLVVGGTLNTIQQTTCGPASDFLEGQNQGG